MAVSICVYKHLFRWAKITPKLFCGVVAVFFFKVHNIKWTRFFHYSTNTVLSHQTWSCELSFVQDRFNFLLWFQRCPKREVSRHGHLMLDNNQHYEKGCKYTPDLRQNRVLVFFILTRRLCALWLNGREFLTTHSLYVLYCFFFKFVKSFLHISQFLTIQIRC